MKKMD
jgi:MFS transporter, Spinster family, sphingosine-1-phosphate transporter